MQRQKVSSQPCSMGKPEARLGLIKPMGKAWRRRAPQLSKSSLMTLLKVRNGGRSWCSPKRLPVVMGMEHVEMISHRYRCLCQEQRSYEHHND